MGTTSHLLRWWTSAYACARAIRWPPPQAVEDWVFKSWGPTAPTRTLTLLWSAAMVMPTRSRLWACLALARFDVRPMLCHCSPRTKVHDKLPYRSRDALNRYASWSLGFVRGREQQLESTEQASWRVRCLKPPLAWPFFGCLSVGRLILDMYETSERILMSNDASWTQSSWTDAEQLASKCSRWLLMKFTTKIFDIRQFPAPSSSNYALFCRNEDNLELPA